MNETELKAKIAELQAEAKELRKVKNLEIRVKVSEKGAISIYGLGSRFPTTLYKEQWAKVFDSKSVIEGLYDSAKTRHS